MTPESNTRNLLVPQVVFVLLLMISIAGWQFARETLDNQSQSRFEQDANHLHEQIQARFDTYSHVLRGGVGLFNVSDTVTREQWHEYVTGLELQRYFPAIRGVGYSQWVGGKQNVASHEQAVRAEGFPTYAVRPAGEREQYSAVIYLEPFDTGNSQALGFDMYVEPIRRAAMEKARDTGEPALSGKVDLLKEVVGEMQSGFILYMPVYRTDQEVPDTVEKRRENITGFVMTPFRGTDLMKGILRPRRSSVNFQIYDGSSMSDEALLYDGSTQLEIGLQTTPAQFETIKQMTIAGRMWTIHYASSPWLTKVTESALPWVLLATGTLFSLLMSGVAWMLISTRRRVVQRTHELRKQSDMNSVLLENLAEGVVACDAEMSDILMNKKAREWCQLDPAREVDIAWGKLERIFKKDGTTPFAPGTSPLLRAVEGATIQSEEICIATSGQEPRFVLVTGGPLPDINGVKSGAVLSLRDITEYRIAMTNIERQQNFLSDVIDNIPNHISARNRDGHLVLANRAYAENIHGMSPDQLVTGRIMGSVDISPPDNEEMREALAVIDRDVSLDYVRAITLQDGEKRWFSIGKLPIRSNNSTDNIVLTVASDITELKSGEERITVMNRELESRVIARTRSLEEANRKLADATEVAEAANLAKSSFLAAMSHEIRTPMNGVVGMVEVLINESRNNELRRSLQMVMDSSFSLLGIIDDILDFSKIEAGQFELDKTQCNLTELVESVVRASVPVARKDGSTVSLYIDPEMPQQALADVTRLRQLLTNLVGNAVKFSSKQANGHVEVRATVQKHDSLRLVLDVMDNGVGMSLDTQAQIFESFVQAESSITRRFGGSGLGLSICKRIVDMMQGEIKVDSHLGGGSRFTISLPLDALEAESAILTEDIQGVDCVLVESDEYNSADIKAYLTSAGAIVHQAPDIDGAFATIHTLQQATALLCTAAHLVQPKTGSVKPISSDTGHLVLSREEHTLGIQIKRVPNIHLGHHETISAVVVDSNALRRHSLIEAVAIAIGRASPEVMHAYAEEGAIPALDPLSVEAAMAAGSCILVVEDDSVNRMVISRQLALLGQTAEFAEDGLEALQKWRNGQYGMIFTDLHMPVMDGYSMTRAIRDEEREDKHIPIVALTANALSGEPRRAAEAGVDGYLTKPLQLHSLQVAVNQHLVLPEGQDQQLRSQLEEEGEQGMTDLTTFDPDALRQLVGDDQEVICECLEEFRVSLGDVGKALVDAMRSRDWDCVDEMAHRLKSSSLSVGALEVWSLCKQIEAARLDNEAGLLEQHADGMSGAMDRADKTIGRFVSSGGTSPD